MKKKYLYKVGLLCLSLSVASTSFTSCDDDNDKEEFVPGDPSILISEIAVCNDSLAVATTVYYEQEVIDRLHSKVNLVQEILDRGNTSEQVINNMTNHIIEERELYKRSRMMAIPYSALIAGWGFDEGMGTDLIGEGEEALVATLKAGPSAIFPTTDLPQFVEDGLLKALHFKNGAHLEVEKYNPASFLGKQLSIAVWLKPDVIKNGNYIASLNYWKNWKFDIQGNGKASFTVNSTLGGTDADNESDLSVPAGVWKHVIVTLDLSNQKLVFYINGQPVRTWTSEGKSNLGGSQAPEYASPLGKQLPFMIGATTTYEEASAAFDWTGWDTPASWGYYEGLMDEIKFYNISLVEGQVKWLYNREAKKLKK